MSRVKQLFALAKDLAKTWPNFFIKLGPGAGDCATNEYMKELRARAKNKFKQEYDVGKLSEGKKVIAEFKIPGNTNLAVDFYFPEEKSIVEIAMGLRNPLSEYERDILKAILLNSINYPVTHLFFFSKPGAIARCNQPSSLAFKTWLDNKMGIRLEFLEFSKSSENILEPIN
jgi:hypothetical protein